MSAAMARKPSNSVRYATSPPKPKVAQASLAPTGRSKSAGLAHRACRADLKRPDIQLVHRFTRLDQHPRAEAWGELIGIGHGFDQIGPGQPVGAGVDDDAQVCWNIEVEP